MACTHVGRRANNEDSHCSCPELGLFAVADGMGGYEGGEIASRLTVAALTQFFQRNANDDEATWPFAMDPALSFVENMVRVAVRIAHQEICEQKRGRLAQMGSTVAALALADGAAVTANVGDSRVYLLRDGELRQLTRDHSLYAEMQAAGMADLPDRASCGFANVITRALGMGAAEPDLGSEGLQAGDTYLLCTDGLVERLDDSAIAWQLAAPPSRACPLLVERAYELGGRDNITAVVVRVVET